jgi:hypothetical protein
LKGATQLGRNLQTRASFVGELLDANKAPPASSRLWGVCYFSITPVVLVERCILKLQLEGMLEQDHLICSSFKSSPGGFPLDGGLLRLLSASHFEAPPEFQCIPRG